MANAADDAPPPEPVVRHASSVAQSGFTMIPNAVMLRADLTPVAKLVYGYLKHLAWRGTTDTVDPPHETIAADLHISVRLVMEAIKLLRKAPVDGEDSEETLVSAKRRGLGRSNVYTINDPADPRSAKIAVIEVRNRPNPARAGSSLEVKTSEQEGSTANAVLPRDDVPNRPPPIPKVDGRNLPLDALAERCGVSERSPRYPQAIVALNGRLHKTSGEILAAGITHLFWTELVAWAAENGQTDRLATLEPAAYADALVRAIHRKADRYRARHGDRVEMSPGALRDWWVDLEGDRPGRGMTPDEMERFGT